MVVLDEYAMVEERPWIGNRVEYRLIPARTLEVLYPEGADLLLLSVTVPPDENSARVRDAMH